MSDLSKEFPKHISTHGFIENGGAAYTAIKSSSLQNVRKDEDLSIFVLYFVSFKNSRSITDK